MVGTAGREWEKKLFKTRKGTLELFIFFLLPLQGGGLFDLKLISRLQLHVGISVC